jgi:hypothetical protein
MEMGEKLGYYFFLVGVLGWLTTAYNDGEKRKSADVEI